MNKNPVTRVINIPARFMPLLERDRDQRGLFSIHELMGHIFTEYYTKVHPLDDQDNHETEILKGVPINE